MVNLSKVTPVKKIDSTLPSNIKFHLLYCYNYMDFYLSSLFCYINQCICFVLISYFVVVLLVLLAVTVFFFYSCVSVGKLNIYDDDMAVFHIFSFFPYYDYTKHFFSDEHLSYQFCLYGFWIFVWVIPFKFWIVKRSLLNVSVAFYFIFVYLNLLSTESLYTILQIQKV